VRDRGLAWLPQLAVVATTLGGVRRNAAVAHWVRSYRGRQGFREHPPLTPVLSPEGRGTKRGTYGFPHNPTKLL